ncbi:RNA polymerase sigma-70 factor, ECF subfamily [Enhydrobacter aerosaccus]|uniref:RNA polymerase sigma-70 factor, ECF subfamily n=1 Tax=Enhydrobacter aerosaccus TaxID=225324 RepID=A0A1T4S1S7_9HYPH|nr:sigma-70 family RNA polymerase sigma factor [Enhydrobacter aerosaccus]SKA22249.1 RNA polymerase sigma-70 factor, ECF subfamily [Enhydrobacter aerosaccus]
MTELNQIDLRSLAAGHKRTWDAFVEAASPLINAVVRRALSTYRLSEDDVLDAAQDVFVRLCANDFRLLKTYDPARAGMSTWLAVVARSAAVDFARRRRQATSPIDEVPETALAVEDRHVEKLKIPDGLLTERQTLILKFLYDEECEVSEVAQMLKIDAQTVRSTHHKALLRLREHFREESR